MWLRGRPALRFKVWVRFTVWEDMSAWTYDGLRDLAQPAVIVPSLEAHDALLVLMDALQESGVLMVNQHTYGRAAPAVVAKRAQEWAEEWSFRWAMKAVYGASKVYGSGMCDRVYLEPRVETDASHKAWTEARLGGQTPAQRSIPKKRQGTYIRPASRMRTYEARDVQVYVGGVLLTESTYEVGVGQYVEIDYRGQTPVRTPPREIRERYLFADRVYREGEPITGVESPGYGRYMPEETTPNHDDRVDALRYGLVYLDPSRHTPEDDD